jgi:hypothetical protein
MTNKHTSLLPCIKAKAIYLSSLCMLLLLSFQNKAQSYVHAFGIGSTSGEEINTMTQDELNNVYVAGNFIGTVDFDPGAGTANLVRFGPNSGFVAKYDEAGNYQWAVDIESGNAPVYGGYGMEVDHAGGLVVSGYYMDTATFDPTGAAVKIGSNGAHDMFIAKYDTAGNFLWAKGVGGFAPDYGLSLAIDRSNNIYVGGYFIGSSDFDPGAGTTMLNGMGGSPDAFIAKYDPNGNFVWAVNVGGTNQDEGLDLAVDTSGNVYLTGYFQNTADFDGSAATANLTSAGIKDIFLVKYSTTGIYQWAKGIGSTGNDAGTSLQIDEAGNVLLTGTFEGTVDFDPSAGGTTSLTSAGGTDIFLAKYDNNGDFVWAKHMGGSVADQANDLAIDNNSGYIYLSGYFQNVADFDPSAATANLTSTGDDDVFMARYDGAGNYLWAANIGGSTKDRSLAMVVENAEYIYLGGTFTGTADFDPSVATANLIASSGPNDIFVAKYQFCQTVTGNIADTICKGESYAWDGQSLTTAGSYNATFQTSLGCDSVVTLALHVDSVETYTVTKNFATLSATALTADYQWIDCNDGNAEIADETAASFTATLNGSYAVVISQNGCVDTSACITIDSIGVGIAEQGMQVIRSAFPNPSQGEFTVELNHATQVLIYDATGKVVEEHQLSSGMQQMNLRHLTNGIYYLRSITTEQSLKLVIIH